MKSSLRILCLDIEGGYGGSSRSLFETISHVDPNEITFEVWCKRAGPAQKRYEEIGVKVRITPFMPKVSSLPRLSRNLLVYGLFCIDWIQSLRFRRELIHAAANVDIIHLNHESLFLLARWLKPRVNAVLTMHIRTNLYGTVFCRWQTRCIAKALDHLIFITENEQKSVSKFSGKQVSGSVIFNSVTPVNAASHEKIPLDNRFKIACLSNYAWVRGIDRTIDIAEAIHQRNRADILFVIAGNMKLPRSLPGELGRIASYGGTLKDYADQHGVSDLFLFLGHISEPERVLSSCNALIKPTREDNPWGRDILEGLAAGKPVISVGTYDTFVEDKVTGILQRNFNAETLAERICELADDRSLAIQLGKAGRQRIVKICNGEKLAQAITKVWQAVVAT